MCFMLLSLKKVTKDAGRYDSPRPPNVAQVWYAPSATNRRNNKNFCDFRKNISTCYALEIFLLSADSAINIRGYPEPHESDGVDIAAFVCTACWAAFSRKVYFYNGTMWASSPTQYTKIHLFAKFQFIQQLIFCLSACPI